MKKIQDFILREIADEYILIPTGKTTEDFNGLITLSDTGAFIWNHLEEVENFNQLITLITSEYEIDAQTASQDAYALLNQMLQVGMITMTNAQENW